MPSVGRQGNGSVTQLFLCLGHGWHCLLSFDSAQSWNYSGGRGGFPPLAWILNKAGGGQCGEGLGAVATGVRVPASL